MGQAATAAPERKPMFVRIFNFPLVALVVAIVLFILPLALGLFIGKRIDIHDGVLRAAVHGAIDIVLVAAAYKLAIARLGDRPRDDLPAQGALRYLGLGLLVGLVIFSLIVAAAAVTHVYVILGYGSTSEFAKDLISDGIMPGFMEELFFRGILFRWLEEFAGSWLALLLSSALFGAAHAGNPDSGWIATSFIAIEAGILLGGAYMLTRSLWFPIGIHAAWNLAEGFVYDVPVSGLAENGLVNAKLSGPPLLTGGAFGLEASVLALVVGTAFGIWAVYLAVSRGELVRPMWVRKRRSAGEG